MNYWVCDCGKKVSATLSGCPYCKQMRQQEVSPRSNQQYVKIAIGLLIAGIIGGGYIFTAREKVSPDKPMYVEKQQLTSQAKQQSKVVPPVAVEAVDALKKLQAKTQVGIAYKDYSPALAEAKFALNLFNESAQSKEFPQMGQSLNGAFETYKMAGEVWGDKFRNSIAEFGYRSEHPDVFVKFPEAEGVIISARDGAFSIDTLVSFLFSKASSEVQKASEMVKR